MDHTPLSSCMDIHHYPYTYTVLWTLTLHEGAWIFLGQPLESLHQRGVLNQLSGLKTKEKSTLLVSKLTAPFASSMKPSNYFLPVQLGRLCNLTDGFAQERCSDTESSDPRSSIWMGSFIFPGYKSCFCGYYLWQGKKNPAPTLSSCTRWGLLWLRLSKIEKPETK